MKTTERCKQIVNQCKEKLKTETDPERRHKIAIVGEEFNYLMRALANTDFSKKVFNDAVKKHWK